MLGCCLDWADDEEAGWRHPYQGGLSNRAARMAEGWIRVLVRPKEGGIGGIDKGWVGAIWAMEVGERGVFTQYARREK